MHGYLTAAVRQSPWALAASSGYGSFRLFPHWTWCLCALAGALAALTAALLGTALEARVPPHAVIEDRWL